MIEFWKYHGLGNDFVVIEDLEETIEPSRENVARMCDRHFGIGADGLLMVRQDKESGLFRMDYWNSDGSPAEMCGNGIRCFVKHCVDRGLTGAGPVSVLTKAGLKTCEVFKDESGSVAEVKVDMGPAEPAVARGAGTELGLPELSLDVGGTRLELTLVSMGNPHAVTFGLGSTLEESARIGPLVERHSAFPDGTNVEFTQVVSRRELKLSVWERGCGLTLACGTGACAAVAAAVSKGLVDAGRMIEVRLPGGTLEVAVEQDLSAVTLKGPAVMVFKGYFEPESLS